MPPSPPLPCDGECLALAAAALTLFYLQWLLQYAQHNLPSNSSAEDVWRLLLQPTPPQPLTLVQQPPSLLTCMLQRGHVLYLPPHWWHATLNAAPYSFFTSYFTQEQQQEQGQGQGQWAKG